MELLEFAKEILHGDKIVLFDVGSRDMGNELRQIAPLVECYAFEPEPEEYERLVKVGGNYDNLSETNKYYSVKYDCHALHNRTGEGTLFITASPRFSSLLEPNQKTIEKFPYWNVNGAEIKHSLQVEDRVPVPVTTLDDVVEDKFYVKHIDYLKLDTQGTELDILQAANKLLDQHKVSVIKCEVWFQSYYKNQPLFCDIDSFLRKKGFRFLDYYPVNDYSKVNTIRPAPYNDRGMLYFSDAYYCLNTDEIGNQYIDYENIFLKYGLVLICLGYVGLGYTIIKTFGKLDEKKLKRLYELISSVPLKLRVRSIAEKLLPPLIFDMLRNVKRNVL